MKLLNAALIALFCGPAWADRQTFPPVDEASQDPTLEAFRADLRAKVAARDLEGVMAATCPEIYTSHGDPDGSETFRANLTIDPETLPEADRRHAATIREDYWRDLETTLAQPGYFDEDGEFWMPYQWRLTLPAKLDPFTAYFVTGQDVTLRQAPNRGAPILDLISHEVVIVPDYLEEAEYQGVILTDGTRGYVYSDFLWSMVGYRAAFVTSDSGDWQLCTFVAGD
ncbi:SH3 domain-containing protein [Ruegeria arenilitoris]|uniref:Bacterial SH3 domain protein n=1 Tax=Ruegeria arenilitoris TaxID=1173585 RepID=A0A238JWN1_9RHOB|nr:SH3 domain-containing protein [Ruegeria arenilitoris]SMX34903.1 hypothetical protein RUA8715_00694 [Ruegeria arenilitoris]